MFKKLFPIILLSILLLSLSSCDGGNDDESRVPSITGISPSGSLTNAADFIIIVSGQDFTSDSVILLDNTPISTTFVNPTTLNGIIPNSMTKQTSAYSEIGRVSLEEKQSYIKVQNSVGTSEQRAFNFYDNWLFPVPSNVNAGEPVIGPDMAITQDANGVLYAVWTHFISSTAGKLGASLSGMELWFARSDNNGTSWTAPQKINGNLVLGDFEFPVPQIMVGSNNILYVIFTRYDPVLSSSFLWITTSPDGGSTWTEPASLHPSSNYYAVMSEYSPAMYLEPVTKNVHHSWSIMTYGHKNAIYYSNNLYYWNRGINGLSNDFSEPVRISNYTGIMQGDSSVAANSTGDVHIVWYQGVGNDFSTKELWTASSTNWGIDFGNPQCIAGKTQINQWWPMLDITVDPSGNVYTVHMGPFNGTISDIFMQKSSDHGATFTSPVNLTNSTGTCMKPSITSDSLGNLTLIYQVVANNMATLYSRRSTDGGNTFSAPIAISTVNIPADWRPSLNKPPYGANGFYPTYAPMSRLFMTMKGKPLLVIGNYHSRVSYNVPHVVYDLYTWLYSLGTGER